MKEDVFEFGPLLVGKTKKDIKETHDPAMSPNFTAFRIENNGPYDAVINFCFKNASSSDGVFLFWLNFTIISQCSFWKLQRFHLQKEQARISLYLPYLDKLAHLMILL